MSTLCRAKRDWQKYGGAEKSESSCFCPSHLSAFLNDPQGNQTERVIAFQNSAIHSCKRQRTRDKAFCPQNTQKDADEEFLFRFCVFRRVLRASLDSVAACRAVPFGFDSRIKNQTPSHPVAASRSNFGKSPVKVSRPISEEVKVIHSVKNRKNRKMDFCRFSIGTCCRPIYSNHNWGKASYGLYVKITHGCMGGEGAKRRNQSCVSGQSWRGWRRGKRWGRCKIRPGFQNKLRNRNGSFKTCIRGSISR